MTRPRSRHLPVLVVVALLLGISSGGRAAAGAKNRVRAAVRDAMLGTYIHGVDDALALEVLGPGAVGDLRLLLKDPGFPRRDNIVAFLAHLDRGAATKDLLAFLSAPPASPEIPEEDRALLLAPQALGHIASRGDASALTALLEMTLPGEGGPLDAAAALSADPDSYHDDLLEAAMRGLALSRAGAARQRLEDLTSGRIRFRTSRRDLVPAARSSLDLFDELTGRVLPKPSVGPDRAIPDGALSAATATPIGGSPADDWLTGSGTDAVDSQTRVHNSALTYANHVMVTNPMTNTRLDQAFTDANIRVGRSDFLEDVSCCASISRTGGAQSFGTTVDGLDMIDNSGELSSVLNNGVARVKVVRAINYCGGPGSNILGCAWLGGNGMTVVRMASVGTEGILWMHEYGHNAGSSHNVDSRYIMYASLTGSNNAVSQAECNAYHFPSGGAGIVPTDTGACTDTDSDSVHDVVDNCPGLSNNNQTDFDQDHLGDDCDLDDDNDGTADAADCGPLNSQVWGTPSEVQDLLLSQDAGGTTLSWTAPAALGSTSAQIRYKKLQSGSPVDFVNGTTCIPDGPDPTATTVSIVLGGPPTTRESDQFFASLGAAVASTDVNDDGFSDVIVGSPFYPIDLDFVPGRAMLYRGTATGLANNPEWSVDGVGEIARLGASLATGDVNNDGFGDVVVGAPGYNAGTGAKGAALVFLGSSSGLEPTATWTVGSDQDQSEFGTSVAMADVNGDGFSDVIVGAPSYDGAFTDEGRVFVYLRTISGLSTVPSWTSSGGQAGAEYGRSVSSAGDVNNDGRDEVIIGAPLYDGGQTDEGRAVLFLGTPGGPAGSPAWSAEANQPQAQMGASVAGGGNVNGDGFEDVIVGAPGFPIGGSAAGAAFLYKGSAAGLQVSASWTVNGGQNLSDFGRAVGFAGDVNGDGLNDLIVGARNYDSGQSDEGLAFVYLGSFFGADTTASRRVEGDLAGANLGAAVAAGGDINNDGIKEFLVGADRYSNPQTTEGRVFVFSGSPGLKPAQGSVFFYLVRAENGCGGGPLGFDSAGSPHTGIFCP